MGLKRYTASTDTWDAFGSPQLNPASLGITTAAIGAVDQTNGVVTTASTSAGVVRNIYVSTSDPSGGSDGDIWVKYI
jgi:hypothetical protein